MRLALKSGCVAIGVLAVSGAKIGGALAQPASFNTEADASVAEAERALRELQTVSKGKKSKGKVSAQSVARPQAPVQTVPLLAGPCNLNGNTNFFSIGDTGFCAAVHGSLTGFMGYDGASNDVGFTSQRLPALRLDTNGKLALSATAPMLYYYNNPYVSAQTDHPYVGTDSMVNLLTFRDTDYGTISAFVNARIFARTETNYLGENRITLNQLYGNYWRGATDQAWIQFEGLRVGIQPTLFSFSRTGYTYFPGYQSYVSTPAVSYTKRFDNIAPGLVNNLGASLSVSAEDPHMRRYADGVLARYDYVQYPDFVGQARLGTPSFLLHMSGAMHQIRDIAAFTFTGPVAQKSSTWGWAAQLAGEYRWKWSNFLGDLGGNMYGKAMISASGTQGAMSYLGIPYLALDYVSGSYGNLERGSGESILGSYEHLWTPVFKTAVTATAFQTFMGSAPEELGLMPGMLPLGFQVRTRGSQVRGNAEYWLGDGWALGVDAGYTWTVASGSYYFGGKANPVNADFPTAFGYMRKAF
jgi:hypothetical protein